MRYDSIDDLPEPYRTQAARQIAGRQAGGTLLTVVPPPPEDPPKRKYHNEPTEVNGIRFDSKKEAARYVELKAELDAGQIDDLRLQHEFTLKEAWRDPDGHKTGSVRYRADFTYWKDDDMIIEDVKSPATRRDKAYQIKRKLMEEKGYSVREV